MAANVDIVIQADDRASSVFGNFTVTLGDVMNIASKVAGVVSGFFADTIKEATEQQDVNAQLQASLESTGNKAGVTMQMMSDLADSQAKVTRFSDDQTAAIEKVALTFTSVNKDIFPQTISLSEDMATKLGIQGTQAMTMIGKAMDDPIKGMGALHRVGVSFTEQQKDQIKALVAAGDTLGAQKLLLSELGTEYGGSALAAGKTFAGQQEILANQFKQVKETIGTALLPVLGQLTGVITANVLPVVERFGTWFAANLPIAIAYVSDTVIPKLLQAWASIKPTVDLVIAVIGAVVQSFSAGGDGANTLSATVQTLSDYWTALQPTIANVVSAIQTVVLAVFGVIDTFMKAHGADIQATMQDAWTKIQAIIKTGIELYNAIVPPILKAIAGFIKAHGTEIQALLSSTWNAIKAVIDAALTLIQGVITVALDLIHGNWAKAWEDIKAMSARIVEDIITVLRSGFENLKTLFGGTIDTIKGYWTAFVSDMQTIGKNIIDGIITGVQNGVGALEDAVKNAAKSALDAAKKALGIASPSKLFETEVGMNISAGIAQGITGGGAGVRKALDDVTRLQSVGSTRSVAGTASSASRTPTLTPSSDTSITFGAGAIVINTAIGQNADQIAEMVIKKITGKIELRRA